MGVFDPRKRVYRLPRGKGSIRGTADILGLKLGSGQLIAIEVKTPKGKVSEDQKEFLKKIESFGGIALVARSLDDVIKAMS